MIRTHDGQRDRRRGSRGIDAELAHGRKGRAVSAVTDDDPRAAVFHEIGQLMRGIGGVQRQKYQAGLYAGGIDGQGLRRFFNLYGHPVTRVQAKIG